MYTSTIIPCKKLLNNLSLHFVITLKGLHSSPWVSTRSSKSSGLYFFSSLENGWFLIFFENCDLIYRYSWVSTIYTLLGLEESN